MLGRERTLALLPFLLDFRWGAKEGPESRAAAVGAVVRPCRMNALLVPWEASVPPELTLAPVMEPWEAAVMTSLRGAAAQLPARGMHQQGQ